VLSQQEISDRFEIQDLLYHYAHLIDQKQIDRLRDEVFTADVHVDYSAMGGSVGDLEETITFLKAALTDELFPNFFPIASTSTPISRLNWMETAPGDG
jgi:hypothetical protein